MLVPSLALRYLTAAVVLVVAVGAGPVPNVPLVKRGLQTTVPTYGDTDDLAMNALSKRAELCAGVDLRSRSRLTGAQVDPKDCSAAAKTNGIGGSYFFTKGNAPEQIKANTNLQRDTKITVVPSSAPQSTNNFKKTCDHILEINILLDVLKSTGACTAAEGLTDQVTMEVKDGNKKVNITVTEGQAKIIRIRDSILRPQNLVAVQSRVESMKTFATQRFNKQPGRNPWDIGSKLDFLAMTEYVLVKSLGLSQGTAVAADAAIAAEFEGNTGGVVALWNQYIAFIIVQRKIVIRLAENELREKKCAGGPSTNALSLAPGADGPKRMVRRSPLDFTPRPLSSLERRAAPRSGPKSRGPACPCKQQPPKKQIPKSQTQTRPKPAAKPRQPAQKPAARAPNPQKRAVPRPANRPRRTPGKAVTPRRTTPRRKPKPVPKPTRRPAGKPRTRRRK